MSPRRPVDQAAPTDPELDAQVAQGSRLDLITAESEDELEGWSRKDRRLFAELLEDASSELQRELLRRALAAGHRPAELHAFADAIRSLSDGKAFAACTLSPESAARRPVEERLQAEADPLYAYLLNGGLLSPREDKPLPPVRLPPGMMVEVPTRPALPRKALGVSSEPTTGRHDVQHLQAPEGQPLKPGNGRFAEDLFNEATRPLGVSFTEQAVDGPGLPLDRALRWAAEALSRGIPIPAVLGAKVGDYRRYVLLLQVQLSGGSRVFEAHDPFMRETAWIHENDLRSGKELPLSDKTLRRITAIALPDGGRR